MAGNRSELETSTRPHPNSLTLLGEFSYLGMHVSASDAYWNTASCRWRRVEYSTINHWEMSQVEIETLLLETFWHAENSDTFRSKVVCPHKLANKAPFAPLRSFKMPSSPFSHALPATKFLGHIGPPT
jgi:hypothetical protein